MKEEVEKGPEEGAATAIRDSLLNLLARVTGTSAAQIREESLLVTDLGLTSIDRLELRDLRPWIRHPVQFGRHARPASLGHPCKQ